MNSVSQHMSLPQKLLVMLAALHGFDTHDANSRKVNLTAEGNGGHILGVIKNGPTKHDKFHHYETAGV